MSLTPLDVRKQEFRRILRGIDPDEVKVFLGEVAEQMERLIRVNAELQERVAELDAKLEEYRSLEKALRDSVVAAQGMRDEHRRQAEKEAELITRNAEQQAERIVHDAEARVSDLKRELVELESDRRNYLIRLRGLIETHMKIVEAGEMRVEALDGARVSVSPPPRHDAQRAAPGRARPQPRAGTTPAPGSAGRNAGA